MFFRGFFAGIAGGFISFAFGSLGSKGISDLLGFVSGLGGGKFGILGGESFPGGFAGIAGGFISGACGSLVSSGSCHGSSGIILVFLGSFEGGWGWGSLDLCN